MLIYTKIKLIPNLMIKDQMFTVLPLFFISSFIVKNFLMWDKVKCESISNKNLKICSIIQTLFVYKIFKVTVH
jgi:hypothetical protein